VAEHKHNTPTTYQNSWHFKNKGLYSKLHLAATNHGRMDNIAPLFGTPGWTELKE